MKTWTATLLLLLLILTGILVACGEDAPLGSDSTTATDTTGAPDTTTEAADTRPAETLTDSQGNPITDTDLHGWLAYGGAQTLRKGKDIAYRTGQISVCPQAEGDLPFFSQGFVCFHHSWVIGHNSIFAMSAS